MFTQINLTDNASAIYLLSKRIIIVILPIKYALIYYRNIKNLMSLFLNIR